jgi:hypothetical protein
MPVRPLLQEASTTSPAALRATALPLSHSMTTLIDSMSERPPWSAQPVERPVPAMSGATNA